MSKIAKPKPRTQVNLRLDSETFRLLDSIADGEHRDKTQTLIHTLLEYARAKHPEHYRRWLGERAAAGRE